MCNDIIDLPTNNVAHYVKFFEQQADKKVQNSMAGPTAQPKIQDRPKVLPPTSPAEIPLPPTRKQGPPSVPSLFRNDPKALPSDYVQIFQNEQVSQFKVNSAPLEPFEPIKAEKESPSKAPELVHLYNSKVAVENKQTQTDREPVASLQIQEEPVALSVKQAKPPTERQEQPLPPKASSTVGERIIKCRNGVPESLIKAIRAFIDKQK